MSGVLGGLFNMVGSGINAGANAMIAKRQRRHEELMTDKQYARQIEQRDYMNEYNSLKNQMARAEEAGLNPHLIYGKGTMGNQPAMPKPEKSGSPYAPVKLNFDVGSELLKFASIKNIQANTDKTKSEVINRDMANNIMAKSMQDQIDFYKSKLKGQEAKNLTEAQKALYTSQMKELAIQKTKYQKALADFAEDGVFQSDPMWQRQISRFGEYIWEGIQQSSEYVPRIDGGLQQYNQNSKYFK